MSVPEMQRVRRGLVPEQMEDKWFIYWKDDAVYFHRSWTGFCIYIVRFVEDGTAWNMFEVLVNRDAEQHAEVNEESDAEMVNYLVDVLLLHQDAAFPSGDASDETSALVNWGQVGRAMLGQHPSGETSLQQEASAGSEKHRD